MIMAYKKGDWVRVLHTDYPEYIKIDEIHKVASTDDGEAVDLASEDGTLFFLPSEIEPWTPRVGERVRFVRDNSDGGAEYGAKGDVVTVKKLWGCDRLDIEVNRFDWHPGAFLKDIEPVTGKAAVDAPGTAAKFKVGDRVRVTDAVPPGWFFNAGDFGEVAEVGEWLSYQYRVKLEGHRDMGHVNDEHIELATAPTPLKIEAGKFYMTRDGRKVGPMLDHYGSFIVVRGDGRIWESDGKGHGGAEDLIAEAQTTTTTPTTTTTAAETGSAIVCLIRDGKPLPASAPYVHDDERSASQEMRRLAGLHKGDTFGVYRLTATCKQTKPTYDHEWQRLAAEGLDESAASSLAKLSGLTWESAHHAVMTHAA